MPWKYQKKSFLVHSCFKLLVSERLLAWRPTIHVIWCRISPHNRRRNACETMTTAPEVLHKPWKIRVEDYLPFGMLLFYWLYWTVDISFNHLRCYSSQFFWMTMTYSFFIPGFIHIFLTGGDATKSWRFKPASCLGNSLMSSSLHLRLAYEVAGKKQKYSPKSVFCGDLPW